MINDIFFNDLTSDWTILGYNGGTTAKFGIPIDGKVDAAEVCLIQGPPGEYYLDGIFVAQCCRGRGYMHRVLGQLTSYADRHKVRLSLVVADFDGIIGEPKLIKVYGRYDFEVVKQVEETGETDMLRLPRP